jgi:uncharacterized protein YceK
MPQGTPYIGAGGVLFGTTESGGICSAQPEQGCGIVFSLTPPSESGDPWVETVLYNFQGGSDGEFPIAGVIPGPNGSLYGTTLYGGNSNNRCTQGCGTLFQLFPPAVAGADWTEQVIFDYGKSNLDPGVLLPGPGGVLFGVTESGGDPVCQGGCGSVYELLPPSQSGGVWSIQQIHLFQQTNGAFPYELENMALGPNGVLYGTASYGGDIGNCMSLGCGVVFSLTPPASPGTPWTFQDLYKFKNPRDGYFPYGGVAIGANGTLYGTTLYGGVEGCVSDLGCGTVYSLTPPASGAGQWTKTVLHSFVGGGDGSQPISTVLIGPAGVLYGVTGTGGGDTFNCGQAGCGVLYELAPPSVQGGSWTETILNEFTSGSGGEYPGLTPAIDANGVLYGYASHGSGTSCDFYGCGVVYQFIP